MSIFPRNFFFFENNLKNYKGKDESASAKISGTPISSPLYPAKYPNNQNCSWIIQAQEPSPGSTVELNILALDIESHSSCNYDKLVLGVAACLLVC
uniref:CUB domain-containing protein n=1 Tax=Buteo japonicus TaxID=224669 RepID=A0A8C0C3J7_9AVES